MTLRAALFAGLFMLAALPAQAAENYRFDEAHTRLVFFVSHTGFANMVGRFKDFSGSLQLDEAHPARSKVDFTVETASVDTDHEGLNEKIRGDNFLKTKQFPAAHFVSTGVKLLGKNKAVVMGNLTLMGVTKPVQINVALNKKGTHPFTKDYVAGFTASLAIKRSDFGINFGLPDLIGDIVLFHIEAEAVRQSGVESGGSKRGRRG